MKERYTSPEMDYLLLATEDVITNSTEELPATLSIETQNSDW